VIGIGIAAQNFGLRQTGIATAVIVANAGLPSQARWAQSSSTAALAAWRP
jgi:hypothetical protein